jgi:hypothetical protein
MPTAQYLFSEVSPSAAGTAASSKPVANAASWCAAGVAGPLDDYDSIGIDVDLVGATGGTLDVYLQQSPDQGVNWYDVVHWTQLASGAAAVKYSSPISQATTTAAPTAVGKNLNPALLAGTVVNGAFSDRMRLLMVAGSGTSAGASVVVRLAPQRSRLREAGGSNGRRRRR